MIRTNRILFTESIQISGRRSGHHRCGQVVCRLRAYSTLDRAVCCCLVLSRWTSAKHCPVDISPSGPGYHCI